ncbi:uncharacterized protein [Epargyreus clarus]|uniref:uncharacterized protein n=1 Tax=Epargyreus clarus TaxID=520877 RepID=UPI003C2B678D
MLILTGNNLGERHKDLNMKVTEAAGLEVDFDEVKNMEEKGDVDKLFKIDLATRYKNIDYILEVLKCGDVFHITKALNCTWIYEDNYSHYINTTYLVNNIFPYMSLKMKRKMLTAISMHLRNGERVIDFYTYCKENKMKEYAHKFLVFTPDSFKLELMKNWDKFNSFRDKKFLKQFIGNSFEVARAYMALSDYSSYIKHELRFLYTVSDEEYLDILEAHNHNDSRYPNCSRRLGIRTSKDILKKYKDRVIKYPVLYINQLNKSMLIRYLTSEDVKLLAFALLPPSADYFWSINYYQTYQFLLSKIPKNELFAFVKELFTSKYPGEPFEMTKQFYRLSYYQMLTIEEREAWALLHIERDEDWSEIENFVWYRFVSFVKAFPGIKRYVFLTPDKDKRSRIVNILPETTRNEDDVIKMLNHYYQRHVNESEAHKESFINKVIEHNDIYSFSSECWAAFDMLFYSLEVYTTEAYVRPEYKLRSVFYHILHNIELPGVLLNYIDCIHFYHVISIIEQLSPDRNKIIATYLMNHYAEKIKKLLETPRDDTPKEDDPYYRDPIKEEIDRLVYRVWNIIYTFKREHDECPAIVVKYMEENMDMYEGHEKFKQKFVPITEEDFVRWLKEDVETAIEGIADIRYNTYRWIFRLSRLFRKLKVYFRHDVGAEYLKYFKEYLADIPAGYREYRNVKMAVVGVFYLADEEFKSTLMEKYIPLIPKIDRRNMDNRVLQVQKAICRLAYHSRPPLPLSMFLKYITGDYVHFCLPVFNNYLANSTSITTFIESILDAPLSIQKHGLRLAFISYTPEALKKLIIDVWNKTKNVSLRMLLYETLFNRILNEPEDAQKELYEVLKLYTSELNKDDHDSVYSLLVSDNLPDKFKGDLIETAWLTVSKFLDKTVDFRRKISVISHMEKYSHLVQREFPRVQIIDEHVHDMLFMDNLKTRYDSHCLEELIRTKWSLTAKYIVSFTNKEEQQRSLELLHTIITQCVKLWDFIDNGIYIARKFVHDFIRIIMNKDTKISERCASMVPIYVCMLDVLETSLKKEQVYLMAWKLKLTIACRKIIHIEKHVVDAETGKCRNWSSEKIAKEFAQKVAKMIATLVEKREFYHCFYQALANIISDAGHTICSILSINNCGYNYYISDTLTDVKIHETHVIALLMLPTNPPYNWYSEHERSIKKIKELDSDEIRCFLYDKYVLSDYCVRNYV